MHALGLEFGSAAQLSKRPGSVWNCLWGNALKRSPGIIRKSRVSYPGPGFLSSATWPSLPKKHYNGLNQTKHTQHITYFFSKWRLSFAVHDKKIVRTYKSHHYLIEVPAISILAVEFDFVFETYFFISWNITHLR